VRQGLTTVPAILAALERRRRRGRPGIGALETALRDLGGLVTDSELETVVRRLLRRTGIDGWVFHQVVEGYEVDFCFPTRRVVLEVDGWLYHGALRRRWERTLERDAHLQALGWLIHHVSWRMVTRNPDGCAARLRGILAER
jgi:very-short-patch-repair endonuclease